MTALPNTRDAARKQNAPKYFTGLACKHGHFAPRYTDSGTCQDCIKANVVAHNQQRNARSNMRSGAREQLVAANFRVSAENYRRVLELAFSLTRIRYPEAQVGDVERKKGGKDAQGGLLLYTLDVHPDDVYVIRSFANSLIPKLVDVAAERMRIFGGLLQAADAAACPEPAFRP